MPLKHKILLLSIALLVLLIGFSVGKFIPPAGNPASRLAVCTSHFPIYEWAKKVAGPDMEVNALEGDNGDPHSYSPSISDLTRIQQARALIVVGVGLDSWSRKALSSTEKTQAPELWEVGVWVERRKFDLAEEAEDDHGHEHEEHPHEAEHAHEHSHEHGAEDPHVWLDPARAAIVVERLGQEFCRLDPAHAAGYTERAAAYAQELKAFSEGLPAQTKSIAGRQVVTLHDGYGYLLDRCGVKLAGVVQVSPGIDASLGDLMAASRKIKALGQRVIFAEPRTTKAAQALADDLNLEVAMLDPLESFVSPCGKTYLERMRHNVNALVEHLR